MYVCMVLCLCVYVGSNDNLDFSTHKHIQTTLMPLSLLFSLHFIFSPLKFYQIYSPFKQPSLQASLMVQWTEIHLPMQGTQIPSLGREDSTHLGATKFVHHNCWAGSSEPASRSYWACMLQLLMLMCLEPVLCNKRSHHNEKPVHHN